MEDAGKSVRTCCINRVVFGNYSKLTDVLNFPNRKINFANSNHTFGCYEDILSAAIS